MKQQESDGDLTCVIPSTLVLSTCPRSSAWCQVTKDHDEEEIFFWSVSTDCVGMGETQCKVTTFPPPIPWRKVRTWKPQATVSTCQLSDDNDKQNEYFTWQSNLSIECVWLCRAQLQSITFKHGKWSKVWVGEEKESQISSESKIESCLSGEYFHCQ